MEIQIEHDGMEYVLTTEHPASHYGIPVLLVNGREYGPADVLPGGDVACDVARTLADLVSQAVRRYNSQMPPQG